MRCYYEVLGVSQTADDAAIKKAYRVQALQWHPDKNQHRLEEADEKFKEISNAYEVLSDQHERAWYDGHREQILKADGHQAGSWSFSGGGVRPADEEDLFSYFSARCFSGYGDDKKGFYAVYDTLFEKLVQQEVRAAEKRGKGSAHEDVSGAPRFGQSTAAWAQVAAFYDYFLGFATLKDFAWADEHNPAAAPNRKVRRLIEDENNKRRKALRRHYNETVRELATFIRKRDKRVLAHNAEEAAKRAAREAEVERKRKEDKAARAAAAAEWKEPDWVTASDPAADSGGESEELQELVDWQCVVCDKLFRSEKALANHERSKKHLEKLVAVREMLQAEEAQAGGPVADGERPAEPDALGSGADATSAAAAADGAAGSAAASEAESEGVPSARLSKKQRGKKQKKRQRQWAAAAGPPQAESDGSDDEPDARPAAEEAAVASSDDGGGGSDAAELDEDDMLAAMMQSATIRQQQPQPAEAAAPIGSEASSTADSDEAAASTSAPQAAQGCGAEAAQEPPSYAEGGGAGPDPGGGRADAQNGAAATEAQEAGSKQAKGKRRRAKRCGVAEPDAAKPPELVCSTCSQEFSSRTKLFTHLSQSGHARLKS